MKKRDYVIDLSSLIMAFIGFYPLAPGACESECAGAGCVKGLFFVCGRRPRYAMESEKEWNGQIKNSTRS
jgi:hypothetical protein